MKNLRNIDLKNHLWKLKTIVLEIKKVICLKEISTVSFLKLEAIVFKTVWNWIKNRYVDQCIRIWTLKINSYIFGKLIFNKGIKANQWEKDKLSWRGISHLNG